MSVSKTLEFITNSLAHKIKEPGVLRTKILKKATAYFEAQSYPQNHEQRASGRKLLSIVKLTILP